MAQPDGLIESGDDDRNKLGAAGEPKAPPPIPVAAGAPTLQPGLIEDAGEGRGEPPAAAKAAVEAPKRKRGVLSHAAAVTGAGLTVGAMCVAAPTAAKLSPSDSLVGDIAEGLGGVVVAGAVGAYASKKASDAFRSTPGRKHGVASTLVDASGVITAPVVALAAGTAAAAVGENTGVGGNAAEFAVGAGWGGLAAAAGTKVVGDKLKKDVVQPGQGQGGDGETPLAQQRRRLEAGGAVFVEGKSWDELRDDFDKKEKDKGGQGKA